MKKIVLSIAGVMAIAAFAPEASALPVFARQTGMACSACHFQHFPLLNGFGRAFKSTGFTMMGAQGKIEGENLDIPNVLNMAVFATAAFQTQSGNNLAANAANVAQKWMVPGSGGEFSLFIGGRISEFAGFLSETGLGGAGATLGAAKLAMLFPVGDARVGLVMHTSGGQGAAYSFETLNTGAAGTHKMMGNGGAGGQHVGTAYASQYFGTNTAATGLSLVANNSMGFINIGRYDVAAPGAGANSMPLTYARVVGTFDLAGFDTAVGLQNFSGSSVQTGQIAKATIIDAQMQGELAGKEAGFYASYGRAPAIGAGLVLGAMPVVGAFNTSTTVARSTFNVAAEVGVIPHSTFQLAFRSADREDFAVTGLKHKDNSFMVGATYDLAQNMGLSLHYTTQSGSYWTSQVAPVGKTATTLLLETAF
ncbi:MAG: hypothetical protein WC216_07475 [Gallionella sp.]|jgi:hypothetical protein